MGKKGKKAKVTGTPDVVKFKSTREYWLLQESMTILESMPFVATDTVAESDFRKVARFLNMTGLLAEHLQVQTTKDYRFNFHHKYLAPTPQFFPFGYDVDMIRQARDMSLKQPGVTYNGEEYQFSETMRGLSKKFLQDVDGSIVKIGREIETDIKQDFANGLKRFKVELKERLEMFDQVWMTYEQEYVKAKHDILTKVFEPVDRLVTLEIMLTHAEERLDIDAKQALENELVRTLERVTKALVPNVTQEDFPGDVIPLAEACIFYESKCTPEWLHLAKWLIKDYLELRMYIAKIPEARLHPELKENLDLIRLLKSFHESVLEARGALEFVSKLPKLIHAKTSNNWLTKKLLEPDLRYIQKTAHLALESVH